AVFPLSSLHFDLDLSLASPGPFDPCFIETDAAGGGDDARPCILGKRNTFGETLAAGTEFRLSRHQHLAASLDRARALEEGNIALDIGREELLRIELLGIDVDRQHAVGPAAAFLSGASAGQ